jgi:hypothetical protein
MDDLLQLGLQRVRFNREATILLYRDRIKPGADTCHCTPCKNFAAQRGIVYSERFIQLLNDLGVDPLKEWEAFDCDSYETNGDHLYGGWFVFCGELIDGLDFKPPHELSERCEYWFTTSFPTYTLPEDAKSCAVGFHVKVPWILPRE